MFTELVVLSKEIKRIATLSEKVDSRLNHLYFEAELMERYPFVKKAYIKEMRRVSDVNYERFSRLLDMYFYSSSMYDKGQFGSVEVLDDQLLEELDDCFVKEMMVFDLNKALNIDLSENAGNIISMVEDCLCSDFSSDYMHFIWQEYLSKSFEKNSFKDSLLKYNKGLFYSYDVFSLGVEAFNRYKNVERSINEMFIDRSEDIEYYRDNSNLFKSDGDKKEPKKKVDVPVVLKLKRNDDKKYTENADKAGVSKLTKPVDDKKHPEKNEKPAVANFPGNGFDKER